VFHREDLLIACTVVASTRHNVKTCFFILNEIVTASSHTKDDNDDEHREEEYSGSGPSATRAPRFGNTHLSLSPNETAGIMDI